MKDRFILERQTCLAEAIFSLVKFQFSWTEHFSLGILEFNIMTWVKISATPPFYILMLVGPNKVTRQFRPYLYIEST